MTVDANRKRKQAKAAIDADMLDVLSSAQGRRVMWEIMERSRLMGSIPELDPYQSQRTLGRRELGLDLHNWVMAVSPRAMLDMLTTRAQQMEPIDEDDDDTTE